MGNGDKVTGLRAEPIFYYLVTSTKCINATVVGHEVTSLDSKGMCGEPRLLPLSLTAGTE